MHQYVHVETSCLVTVYSVSYMKSIKVFEVREGLIPEGERRGQNSHHISTTGEVSRLRTEDSSLHDCSILLVGTGLERRKQRHLS